MRFVIRGFKRAEVQNCDQVYVKKDKYFENQFREDDAENDVLKYIQPLFNPQNFVQWP